MYRIRGSDQKEYGPLSADQLKLWIAQNRVNGQTLVQIEGGADWKPLDYYAEFEVLLRNRPAAATVIAPGPPAKTSGLAIASLVLGCLGFCGITAIIGLILGLVAQRKIKQSNGQLTGSGMALAGIIVSVVMFIPGLAFTAGLFLPAFAAARTKAQTIQCINNMKQLALSFHVFAGDHDDRFPPAATWCDAIQTSVGSGNVFLCPRGNASQRSSYAFNGKLDGRKVGEINPNTVLLFEVDDGWNRFGGPELLLQPSRHVGRYIVAFSDGHVEQLSAARLSQLRWDP
jgi:prepilin-type processing-associated H-X9-DG protein